MATSSGPLTRRVTGSAAGADTLRRTARGEPSDASFERYFSFTAGRRGGTFGVEADGRGSSERKVGTVKELSAQLREVQVSAPTTCARREVLHNPRIVV